VSGSIEADILEGGWRALCAGMLLQTVKRLAADTNLYHRAAYVKGGHTGGNDKEGIYQRTQARRWIEGGIGQIQFDECCEAIGVDSSRAREKILEHCQKLKRKKPGPEFYDEP
jgi:hypothetical protein